MALFSRKTRIKIIKVLALLSIVRWPNLLLTALAQYIAAVFVFNPQSSVWVVLANGKLHLIVFTTACILAAGFIINSFYDIEKDLVNRPHKTLFDRVVSKSFCLNAYLVLNSIGLILSLLGSFNIFIFFLVYAFGLWFYSHKLQKITLVREFSASLLSVAAFFSIGFHYKHTDTSIIIYALIIMQILFIRELIKDLRHFNGDKAAGNQTIAVMFGPKKSRYFYLFLSIILTATLAIFQSISYTQYAIYLVAFLIVVMALIAALLLIQVKNGPAWAHRIWKIVLMVSIFYLIFFRAVVT